MIPYYHNTFSFRGFYDSGPHIAIFAYSRPYEIIAHEATHGTVTTLSSLGFIQQLAGYLHHFGDTCDCAFAVERANAIDGIVQENSVIVHEATAWLVTKLAENLETVLGFAPRAPGGIDQPVPTQYKPEVDRLRSSLEAVPGKGFYRLEESVNDHDPLFLTPSLLAISMASFALSPPFVRDLLHLPSKEFENVLRGSLTRPEENPLARFHRLQDRIRSTDFAKAEHWARWVKRWMYGKPPERCPVELDRVGAIGRPVDDDHSGYLRSQVTPMGFGHLMSTLSEGQLPASHLANVDWQAMAQRYRFEPHVLSHFQTCIIPKPTLIQDFCVAESGPSKQLMEHIRFINVSIGEDQNFRFKRFGKDNVELTLGPSPDETKRLVWRTTVESAKRFLGSCVEQGKGIVTASVDYDLRRRDLRDRNLLRDFPHVVVAVTDVRSLWLRMTDSAQGGFNGAKRFKIVCVQSFDAPELYGFLTFKSDVSFPLIIIPVLLRCAQHIHSIVEELMTPGYALDAVAPDDLPDFVGVCEPSIAAAYHWLHEYFTE